MKKDRLFIARNWISLISYFFVFSPIIGGIVIMILKYNFLYSILCFFLSYFAYAIFLHFGLDIIVFKKDILYVFPNATPFEPRQKYIRIYCNDIIIANFSIKQKKIINIEYDFPFLTITTSDENNYEIMLGGFTFKQVQKIEKQIICHNKDVLFDHDSSFIKFWYWKKH